MTTDVLVTADTLGGVFTYAVTLARELAHRDVTTHLATMGAKPRAEQRALLADVPGLVLHESTYALEWMDDPWEDVRRAGEWLLALEREIAPSIVHLNGYAHGMLPFRAPKIVVGHSCVLSWWEAVHGEPAPARYDTYRRAVSDGLAAADAVVTISHAMRAALRRHYGVDAEVIYNGGNAPAEAVPKEPFVLTCGRVGDLGKNVQALARVAERLTWPVRVAGWDSDAYPGLEPLGWLGAPSLGAWMDRASIFALPARYEPFGLSPLEAASRGAALVLGDIPSLREIWGSSALFVAPEDHDGLLAALRRLIGDADLRTEYAARAKERATRYPASTMAGAMLEIWTAACA
jgi:glycogen synthase